MRRSMISISAVAVLVVSSIYSVTYADPLAPGKPAGVRAAQMGNKEWLVLGGAAAVAAALAIASAGGGHSAVATQPITIVSPTTT